jgi:hypothetical protein
MHTRYAVTERGYTRRIIRRAFFVTRKTQLNMSLQGDETLPIGEEHLPVPKDGPAAHPGRPADAGDTALPPAAGEGPAPDAPGDEARHPEPQPERPPPAPGSLEERIRRLEDVLASLQQLQTAVQAEPPSPPSAPAAEEHAHLAGLLAVGQNLLMPSGAVPAAMPRRSQRWLPLEVVAELRSMLRMYLDPRYRVGWQGRLFPPILIVLMFFSWWILGSIPFVGFFLDRVVFLFLAYLLFKVLMREATRYRMTSPDLPASLRL